MGKLSFEEMAKQNKIEILQIKENNIEAKGIYIPEAIISFNDDKKAVYKEERALKKIGIDLPFMVDLSNKLSYYGLVDETILSMSEMVNHLWK